MQSKNLNSICINTISGPYPTVRHSYSPSQGHVSSQNINVFFVQRPALQPFRFGEVFSCQSDHILYKEFKLANMRPTYSTISSPFWEKSPNNNYLPKCEPSIIFCGRIYAADEVFFGKCKWCRDPPIAPCFNQWRFQPFPSKMVQGGNADWPGQRVGSMMPSL